MLVTFLDIPTDDVWKGNEIRERDFGISLTRCTLSLENTQYNAVGFTLLSVVALSVCCLHSSLTFCIPAF